MKRALFWGLFFIIISYGQLFAATYYVSQNASGRGDGSSIANIMSITSHNQLSFSPGDTIFLCGTIKSTIIPRSDGKSGLPITYRGDYPGHTLNLNVTTSGNKRAISLSNRSYITLTNADKRPVIDCGITSGDINGSSQNNNQAIDVNNASNIIIDNWEIKNGWTAINGVNAKDIVVTRCYVHQMRQNGVNFSDSERITIGGSKDKGNEFYQCTYKTAYDGNAIGADIKLNDIVNGIISYNHCHGTTGKNKDGWGMIGIALYGSQYIVCEYNTIHDHGAKNQRPPIHCKSEYEPQSPGKYVVIRYNNIFNEEYDSGWDYGYPTAIIATRNNQYYWIYGNRIQNCASGIAAQINGTYNHRDGMDGTHVNDFYIWGNVISQLEGTGIGFASSASTNTDDMYNMYVINNTIHKANEQSFSLKLGSKNIGSGSAPYITIMNNIFSEARYGESVQYDLYCLSNNANWFNISDNLHYDPKNLNSFNVKIGYNSSNPCFNTPCAYDSANVTNGFFSNVYVANPYYLNSSLGDVRLTDSSKLAINRGEIVTIKIPNLNMPYYQSSPITFSFNEILHPSTDWSTHPPKVVVGYQDRNGIGFEKGAYIFVEGSIQPSLSKVQGVIVEAQH